MTPCVLLKALVRLNNRHREIDIFACRNCAGFLKVCIDNQCHPAAFSQLFFIRSFSLALNGWKRERSNPDLYHDTCIHLYGIRVHKHIQYIIFFSLCVHAPVRSLAHLTIIIISVIIIFFIFMLVQS